MPKSLVIIALLIVLGIAVPTGVKLYQVSMAFECGVTEARQDLALGKCEFKFSGLGNSNRANLIDALKNKGVRYSVVDAADWEVFRNRDGYNSVVIPYLRKNFSIDVGALLNIK